MKKISFYGICFAALFAMSCSGTKISGNTDLKSENKTVTDNTKTMNNDYYQLKEGESIYSFIGKKVSFEVTVAEIPMQHMMKFSPPMGEENEGHEYIDISNKYKGGQIVAYFYPSKVNWPKDKGTLRVYGTMQKMSGAGKGGGTHTEYYLDLDKVESAN